VGGLPAKGRIGRGRALVGAAPSPDPWIECAASGTERGIWPAPTGAANNGVLGGRRSGSGYSAGPL